MARGGARRKAGGGVATLLADEPPAELAISDRDVERSLSRAIGDDNAASRSRASRPVQRKTRNVLDDDEALGFALAHLIQIIGEDQVMLKVTVAEVSRNVMKQLGVNLIAGGDSNGISWGAITGITGMINVPGVVPEVSEGG